MTHTAGATDILERVLTTRQHPWIGSGLAHPAIYILVPVASKARLRAIVQIPLEQNSLVECLLSGILPGPRDETLPEHYRLVAEALDHALDSWKTDQAREANFQPSAPVETLSQPPDSRQVAAGLSCYFDCPVAVWIAEAGLWRCVAIYPQEPAPVVLPLSRPGLPVRSDRRLRLRAHSDHKGTAQILRLGLAEVLQSRARMLLCDGMFAVHWNYEMNLLLTQEKSLLDFGLGGILNASRYATGAWVALTLSAEDEAVKLTVAEEGPGIPENDLARLIENRFRALHEAMAGYPHSIRNRTGRSGLEESICGPLTS